MKAFILILSLLISSIAIADPTCEEHKSEDQVVGQLEITTDVPRHLKGATIIVRTADGRESTVPAERFKVVPRKQQFLTTKTLATKLVSCTVKDPHKNRVSALGGYGTQEGLDVDRSNPASVSAQSKVGAVGGLQYQRLLTERLSVGVQGQTNKTGSLLLGVDF